MVNLLFVWSAMSNGGHESLDYFFLEKGTFINFKVIHQDDTSFRNFHNICQKDTQPIKKFKKLDKLVVVNPTTRPPPMCPGKKKNPWPPAPKNETPLEGRHVR